MLTTSEKNGLIDNSVASSSLPFPIEPLRFQLDTALMASEKVDYKALDPIRNGSGERCRALMTSVFRHRQKLDYSAGKLTVVSNNHGKS